MIDFQIIGKRIKHCRKRHGLSQSDLAELLDVSISYISQIERGTTTVSLKRLDEIAKLINTDIEHLIIGAEVSSSNYLDAELHEMTKNWSPAQKELFVKIAVAINGM